MARVLSMTTRLAHRNKDALKPDYLKLADGALAEGSAQLMQDVTVGALYDALTVRLHWPAIFLENLMAYFSLSFVVEGVCLLVPRAPFFSYLDINSCEYKRRMKRL